MSRRFDTRMHLRRIKFVIHPVYIIPHYSLPKAASINDAAKNLADVDCENQICCLFIIPVGLSPSDTPLAS